jgi:hypothetical protein
MFVCFISYADRTSQPIENKGMLAEMSSQRVSTFAGRRGFGIVFRMSIGRARLDNGQFSLDGKEHHVPRNI